MQVCVDVFNRWIRAFKRAHKKWRRISEIMCLFLYYIIILYKKYRTSFYLLNKRISLKRLGPADGLTGGNPNSYAKNSR